MGEHGLVVARLTFGSLVREYRHEAGLTQRELAAKAGLSVAALRDFEQSRRHRPRPNSLAALAEALGLDPDQAASLAAPPRCRGSARPRCHHRAPRGTGLSSGRAALGRAGAGTVAGGAWPARGLARRDTAVPRASRPACGARAAPAWIPAHWCAGTRSSTCCGETPRRAPPWAWCRHM